MYRSCPGLDGLVRLSQQAKEAPSPGRVVDRGGADPARPRSVPVHREAGSFSWIPFGATLSYEHALSTIVLFKKCFLYGVAVWLFRNAGYGHIAAAVGIVAVLGSIEAAQRYLPGRTPEITDPLLALMMAVLLYFADRHKRTALGPS